MGKHELKNLLCDFCPASVYEAPPHELACVWVQDTITQLRGSVVGALVKDRRPVVGIDEILCALMLPAIEALRTVPLVVAVFDKPSFVTVAKAFEQSHRDAANNGRSNKPVSISSGDPQPGAAPANGMQYYMELPPMEWKRAIEDRGSRRNLIARIARRAEIVLPARLRAEEIPPDHVLAIDFEDFDQSARVVSVSTEESGPRVDWGKYGKNNIGEFDVACLHHLYALERAEKDGVLGHNRPMCVVDTIDTDLIPITALHADKLVRDPLVVLAGKTSCLRFRTAEVARWVRLQAWRCSEGEDPLEHFVRIFVLAGSDFVRGGVPGVGNRTLIQSWLESEGRASPEQVVGRYCAISPPRSGECDAGDWLDGEEDGKKGAKCWSGGVVHASAAVAPKRKRASGGKVDPKSAEQWARRANWALNYWKFSATEQHQLFATCIGHGWSLTNGQVVPTESLGTDDPSPRQRKRSPPAEGVSCAAGSSRK